MSPAQIAAIQAAAAARRSLTQRLCIAAPVAVLAGVPAAAHLMLEAAAEIDRLRNEAADNDREARHAARDAAAETRWQERQGEDYGSY